MLFTETTKHLGLVFQKLQINAKYLSGLILIASEKTHLLFPTDAVP